MEWIIPILQWGFPILLALVGYIFGTTVERAHFRRLRRNEANLQGMVVTDLKTIPPGVEANNGVLITGAVVIGSDYFKTLMASFRKLIGGEIRSYESLMERARREALVRLLTEAKRVGADTVINVRLETASIGAMNNNPVPMVEVVAYGTALTR